MALDREARAFVLFGGVALGGNPILGDTVIIPIPEPDSSILAVAAFLTLLVVRSASRRRA